MVSKNSRMHLNTLYDKKLVLANLRNFEKKNENRVGKHSLMAQINGRMLLVLTTFHLMKFDHVNRVGSK